MPARTVVVVLGGTVVPRGTVVVVVLGVAFLSGRGRRLDYCLAVRVRLGHGGFVGR
ncbi:hypothetical protein [Streptomyces sp. WAC06614]|uniref:hypothetical protein n=1 Tax=Streptomyces sp. WAC06614 TaxID=2487416 RepID=UPI00163CE831|nr:hypothetical protein [Streptomyces sp. WAC06614]